MYFKISKLQATLVITYIFSACFFRHFIISFHLENKRKPSDRLILSAHRIRGGSGKSKGEVSSKKKSINQVISPRRGWGDHWKFCHGVVGTEVRLRRKCVVWKQEKQI